MTQQLEMNINATATPVLDATAVKPDARTAPEQQFKSVRMSVKSGRRIDFVCDLSALVDLKIPAEAWYGKGTNKSANICEISAQRLRVEGLQDVYVDMRVYTKEQAYEARKILFEKEVKARENLAKLEGFRTQAEALAPVMGKSVEEVMQILASNM
jgi:hypothetical protein